MWFNVTPDDEVIYYQKEGTNPGASVILRHYPKTEISVILLSNLEEGVWEPVREIHKQMV